jgi:RNA polymerase sigma-54 factor
MHSISLIQENQTSLKQQQQLLINLAMRQAFHVLQMPMLELSEWLKSEIENNPVLDVDLSKEQFKERLDQPNQEWHLTRNRSQQSREKRRQEQQENLLTAPISLYEHLMRQAPLIFEQGEDLQIAALIIGHLNDKGFLDTPLEEVAPSIPLIKMQKVLETIQSFDPPGIAARNLQECLLLQLKIKNKSNSKGAKVISEHFEDLLHNRLPHISERLHIPIKELVNIVRKEIAPLDLNPGYRYCIHQPTAILPDLLFLYIEDKWQIEINTSFFPKFHIAPVYREALRDHSLESEEYHYLRRHLAGGKWLQRIVQRRNNTLRSIGEFLLKKQRAFFEGSRGSLVPLSMKEAALEIGIHESTVARAVNNKFVGCPQGMFAMRSFFKQGVETSSGEKISSHSLKKILAKTIEEEDKCNPLSDDQLSGHFKKLGIPAARRTITKYRSLLRIAPAFKRKKWA